MTRHIRHPTLVAQDDLIAEHTRAAGPDTDTTWAMAAPLPMQHRKPSTRKVFQRHYLHPNEAKGDFYVEATRV